MSPHFRESQTLPHVTTSQNLTFFTSSIKKLTSQIRTSWTTSENLRFEFSSKMFKTSYICRVGHFKAILKHQYINNQNSLHWIIIPSAGFTDFNICIRWFLPSPILILSLSCVRSTLFIGTLFWTSFWTSCLFYRACVYLFKSC